MLITTTLKMQHQGDPINNAGIFREYFYHFSMVIRKLALGTFKTMQIICDAVRR